MSPVETVKNFLSALQVGDLEAAGDFLADEFRFFGLAPDPLGKTSFLELIQAQRQAEPGWQIRIRLLRVDGSRVYGKAHLLDRPDSEWLITLRQGELPPGLGELLAAPEERHEYHLQAGRIVSLIVRQPIVRNCRHFSLN